MSAARRFGLLIASVLLSSGILSYGQSPRFTKPGSKPTESEHIKGPNGLDSWTLNWPVPDSNYGDQPLPFTLVLARNGHKLRHIQGDPFVWKWMFWSDGGQVAYETGPLHFSMTCVLIDVGSGRQVETVDCWQELPTDAPDWAKALENRR